MGGALLGMVGTSHGALKAPVLRAEFMRSEQHLIANATRRGLDPTDLVTRQQIRMDAYTHALESIFKQRRGFVDRYQAFQNKMADSSEWTSKSVALALKALLPVVRIPTNIVAETAEYLMGPVAHPRIMEQLIRTGTKDLTTAQAETFMRSLKKGALGIPAMITLGYLMNQKAGGFYIPGDQKHRPPAGLKYGELKVGDVTIPADALHNPLANAIMFGATMAQAANAKTRQADKDPAGLGQGMISAALGLADEIPFVDQTTQLNKLMDPYQRGKWWDNFATSLVIPQISTAVAKYFDKDSQGNTIVRDPKGLMQTIQASIPGEREKLPEKKH